MVIYHEWKAMDPLKLVDGCNESHLTSYIVTSSEKMKQSRVCLGEVHFLRIQFLTDFQRDLYRKKMKSLTVFAS